VIGSSVGATSRAVVLRRTNLRMGSRMNPWKPINTAPANIWVEVETISPYKKTMIAMQITLSGGVERVWICERCVANDPENLFKVIVEKLAKWRYR